MTPDDVAVRLELHDLLHAYAAAVDTRDWTALAALFTSKAVLDYTASRGPRADVAGAIQWLRGVLAGFAVTQHLVTNVRVQILGDDATSVCSYFNPMQPAEGPLFLVGGTYRTSYVRSGGSWLITEHVQDIAWMHRPGS